ncbi:hypothetical protein QL285_083476 [Trifolium repens]|nr:hypothetical protein QL285_083476 [Trifolium repens]
MGLVIPALLYWFSLLTPREEGHNYLFCSCFPCKNSLVRKSGREFFSPLICSISKSKHDNKACHLAKICLETKFLTSFCKTSFAALQSDLNKNFFENKSS